MTPGLTRGPPFPSEATKGSIVAVASLENPSVPKVVGVCEIDISSLQEVQGAKGHAVRGYHWDGDEIWAWTQNGRSGSDAPDRIDGWDPQDVGQCLSQGLEALSTADHDSDTGEGGVSLRNHDQDGAVEQVYNKYVDGVDAISDQEGNLQEQDLSTKGIALNPNLESPGLIREAEIDDYFLQAFYYGVHYQRETHQETPGRGLSFPISQSLIISHLVLPYLPIWTPAQAASLQMKRTSWKSVRKFVKALDKRQLLKCKDRDGGETVILDIDFDDPVFTDFVPYKLPKRDVTAQLKEGEIDQAAEAVISTRDDSIGQRVNVLKLLKPKEQLSPLFEASNASIKALYLAIEVRNVVASYIELEKLTSVTNKRLINLNPFLANTIFDGKSSLDPEIIARGSVPRDALIDRIVDNCLPFFAILRNDDTRETVQAKAGQSPKIQLTYQTRSGNKIVTKISGLEVFHINAQILADELQKACASSTSVGQLMGSSPKNPIMEVIVQGPQKDMVQKALEKRGIHPKWIEVVDKVKGGKHARKT